MRCGWIRPSSTSRSSVSRPTSRRTGSKQDSRTASGVSSMIRLTPVTDSNARMLRPSRPMIRPFISSPGRCSTDDHGLAGLLAGDPLDGQGDDLAGPLLAVLAGLGLDVPDDQRGLALGLVLDARDQLGLGLVGGEAGGALQHGAALLVQAAELGPLPVDLPLRLGQRVAALLGLARVLVDPLLALGQPGFPALQVAAQLPDLFLDLPDLVLDLAARGGGLLGCGLRPAHDRGRVGLGPVPDLAGLSGGVGQDAVTLFRAALFPFLLLRGIGAGGASGRRGGREVTGAGAPPEDDENQGDKRGDEPDRQDQLDSVTQRSPLPLMGADLPPGRYIGHALQRGAACRCDQAPGQPGTGPPRWQPSGGAATCMPRARCRPGWRPPRQPLDARARRLVADGPRPDHPAWTWRAAVRDPS